MIAVEEGIEDGLGVFHHRCLQIRGQFEDNNEVEVTIQEIWSAALNMTEGVGECYGESIMCQQKYSLFGRKTDATDNYQ